VSPERASASAVLFEVERRRQRVQLWAWRSVAAVLALALVVEISVGRRGTGSAPVPRAEGVATVTLPAKTKDVGQSVFPVSGEDYIAVRNRMIAFENRAVPVPVAEVVPKARPIRRDSAEGKGRTTPSLLELFFTQPEAVRS
jgi:hypothetical protein